MHAEFQYTRDDYREMLAANQEQQQKWLRLKQRQGKSRAMRVVVFVTISFCVFLCLQFAGPVGRILLPDIGNLWLKLSSPLLCTVVVLVGAVLVVRLAQSGRLALAEGGLRTAMSMLLVLAAFVPCVCLPSAIDLLFWSPAISAEPPEVRVQLLAQELLVVLIPWICIAVFIWTLVYRHISRNSVWETSTHLHRPKTLDIDSGGITIADAVSRSELKWLAICQFTESTHLFLLYLSQQQLWFIPKRALSETDLPAFRHLLQAHIGDGSRAAAFEVLPVARLAQAPLPAPPPRK